MDVNLIAYSNDPTPEPTFIDLYENERIAQTWRFTDIADFGTTGGFSREFRIPNSPTNAEYFGPIFNVNLSGWFDFRIKVDARIQVNTLDIAQGFIQVKRVVIRDGHVAEYEIVFFAEVPNLSAAIGDKMIGDLAAVYNECVNTMDYSVMAASVAGTLNSGYVIYTLCDRGQNFSEDGSPGTQRVFDADNPLYVGDFTPAINAGFLWQRIISEAGFYYEGAELDAILADLWVPWLDSEGMTTEVIPQGVLFKVGRATDLAGLNGTPNPEQITGLTDSGTGFYDNGANFAGDTFTAPHTGWFQFKAWAHLTRTAGSGLDVLNLRLGNSAGTTFYVGGVPVLNNGTSTFVAYLDPSWVFLTSGQTLSLFVNWISFGSGNTYTAEGSATNDEAVGTGFMMTEAGDVLQGSDWQPWHDAPEMRQSEFIRSIIKMFNLALIPDKATPNKFIVELMADYIGSGSNLDWTPKLDISKDVQIYPTNEFQSRTLLWTYKPDGDMLNKLYQDQAGRTYGWFRVLDTGNDFATGENKVELDFSPTPCNAIPGTNIVIPKFLNDQGKFFKPRPRILYRAGTATGVQVWDDTVPTPAAISTEVVVLNHYSTVNPSVQDFDLNFGQEIPLQSIQAAPYNTLYNTYWRRYIREIYGGLGTDSLFSQPFIMEAYFNLTTADILTFTFADQIWIHDSYWRILEINDFVVGGNEVTKVKLMKIIDNELECTWTPYTSGVGGLITFVAADGVTTGAGTEACCEKYNYVWDDADSVCFAFPPDDGPKPPAVPNEQGQAHVNTGAMSAPFTLAIDNYTVQPDDYTVQVDTTAGVKTITLPSASANLGRIIVVKKIDSSGNKVIVDGGPDNVDGAASIDITTQYASRMIQSTGREWSVIAEK